jgi:hypothetical protein
MGNTMIARHGKIKYHIKNRIKRYHSIIASFILGAIIGITIFNGIFASRLDLLYQINESQSAEIMDKTNKLEKLESSLNKYQYLVVTDIKVELDFRGSDLELIALEKYAKDLLKDQLGKRIQDVDVDMIFQVFNERIVSINEENYILYVRTVILSDVLDVKLRAEIIEDSNEG